MKAWRNAFMDRRKRKRDFRRLWITRINAASRIHGMSYSQFMSGLKKANIELNRKSLAQLAVSDSHAFSVLAKTAKEKLAVKA
jgi:large subunit ribosomal protein L20